MFQLRGQVSIRRQANDVTEFLADPSNERQWQKDVVHVELVEGTPGQAGARHERVQVVSGRNIKTVNELAAHEAARHVAFSAQGKVIRYRAEYDVTPQENACTVALRLEGEMLGFASMFEGMAAEALERDVPTNLDRLRQVLEADHEHS